MTSEEFHEALQRERFRREPVENDNRRLRAALTALLSGDVGRQTLAKLAGGQGTDTDDGRAWLHAANMVRYDYPCEDCIGMKEHGCYCKSMNAIRPGGPSDSGAPNNRFFPFEFEVWQGDEMVASASGPRDDAMREAMNYAAQYEQDGPVRVFEVTRTLVTPNVLADRREPIGEASSPKGDGRAAG